jgi:hypothetical protein
MAAILTEDFPEAIFPNEQIFFRFRSPAPGPVAEKIGGGNARRIYRLK